MYNKHFVTKIVLQAIVIVAYVIVTSIAPSAAASTEQSPKTLHEAAKAGKIADVKSFISKGADVNAKDGAGRTPLHYAIQRGHKKIAELLLSEQIRPLSRDLTRIALARKRLQQLTNHAAPFEKKLLDIEELLIHIRVKNILPVLEWEKLKELKIKEILNGLDAQTKAYFEASPEPQSDKTEMMILSLLKNAINEFLEAGRILDESDAAYDDDALFSKVLYVLSKRQETAAQQIFARIIKNLSDWQEKVAESEPKVSVLEARLHKERHEFSKMGENNYKIFQVDASEYSAIGKVYGEGDVNGDGFKDVLINESSGAYFKNRSFLFFGGKDIDFSSPDIIFSGGNTNENFAQQSGVFADINNDGYDDIAIGASRHNDNDGRVYIYYGGPTMDAQEDIVIEGEAGKKSGFGNRLSAADIDNDGYIDILVGAQSYDDWRGCVYLFWGGKTMDTTADVIFQGEAFPDNKPIRDPGTGWMVQGMFGRRINAGGDVNGDGYQDILIGARYAGEKKFNGSAYLFLGNTKENMDAVCDHVFRGENAMDQMGSSLDLFDIDNDGFSDVIVGARFAKNFRGAVYIWWGGKDFDGNRPADIVLQGELRSNMGGDDIACADFNNDGYGDVLVGAFASGQAYLFYGNNRTLMDTDCDYIFDPENKPKRFGLSLSAGDFNNDGYLDGLIGAGGKKGDSNGKAFLYFGPFTTEDIQDEIKAQQALVTEVEEELSDAKKKLDDASKFVPSSADLQGIFEGLPESLRRFLTPELEQLQAETVSSLRDDSYVLREGIRENQIGMSDIELSAYIDELTQQIDDLKSKNNRDKDQEEELEILKNQLSWFEKVKYVPREERETKKNILHKEMTMLRRN